MPLPAALLHSVSASIMLWGYSKLDSLVSDAWIREQKGGHWQYLTVQGLTAACLTMLLGLGGDLFPSVKGFRRAQRMLLMISLPVSIVVAFIYWTLVLLFPTLILPPVPNWKSEPSSSSAAPPLSRVPLGIDLALHASPMIALVTDFALFQAPYSFGDVTYTATGLAVLSGVSYGSWTEYCAIYNGDFPYPFLTASPLIGRLGIYAGTTLLALLVFRGINYIHPRQNWQLSF